MLVHGHFFLDLGQYLVRRFSEIFVSHSESKLFIIMQIRFTEFALCRAVSTSQQNANNKTLLKVSLVGLRLNFCRVQYFKNIIVKAISHC